jgi:transcriptional regulator with XRE-family HTH domain
MIDHVLSEFIDAWNAGWRPQVAEYLERVGPAERDELAGELMAWLAVAPAPAYAPAARKDIRGDPAVRAVLAATSGEAGLWPELLPRLRGRAGLSVSDVAARVVAPFGLAGEEARAAGYLERMERGELEAARVSARLLDALGDLLGASGTTLAAAGRLGGAMRPTAAGGALFRGGEDAGEWVARDIEALSRAAMRPAPPEMDELDRLFTGGPEA